MTTGFPKKVRDLIEARAGGQCEAMWVLTCNGRPEQIHHRRPRGAGGSKAPAVNRAGNGIFICEPCHRLIESQRMLLALRGCWCRSTSLIRRMWLLFGAAIWCC
ncbi:HNH endonuclease [Rhodococcus hoagii]|nr:HNH endonuclease [Prescottella equi]